jgi:hypothetical protein
MTPWRTDSSDVAHLPHGDVDQKYVDLVVPGFIEFERAGSGSFQFATVSGGIDWRHTIRDSESAVEWCWEGWSDTDAGSDRGWAIIAGRTLISHIYVFDADDSEFTARCAIKTPKCPRQSRSSRRFTSK